MFDSPSCANVLQFAMALFTLCGGIFALHKWRKGKDVDRASQLAKLRTQFYAFEPDVLLEKMTCAQGDCHDGQDMEAEVKRKSFFSFLAHICYLNETGVISEKEFCVFKWQIVRILESPSVMNMLSSLYSGVIIRKGVDKPFYSLVKYGAANCIEEVRHHYKKLIENRAVKDAGNILLSISDNKSYRTHLDVLNGIFNFDYTGHMKATAVLPNGDIIWFPEVDENCTPPPVGRRDRWYNILASGGKQILECSPVNEEVWKDNGAKRYVFGKYRVKGQVEYKFMGVFKPYGDNNGINRENFIRTYERVGTEIKDEDVANAYGTWRV